MIGKLNDNVIVWILSAESQGIRILISIFERLVEVREQDIYEPGVSAEKSYWRSRLREYRWIRVGLRRCRVWWESQEHLITNGSSEGYHHVYCH